LKKIPPPRLFSKTSIFCNSVRVERCDKFFFAKYNRNLRLRFFAEPPLQSPRLVPHFLKGGGIQEIYKKDTPDKTNRKPPKEFLKDGILSVF
jgi:hypothetical protein